MKDNKKNKKVEKSVEVSSQPETKQVEVATPPRLVPFYKDSVVPKLREQFKYKNVMEIPRLQKITINMGLGEAIENAKILDAAVEELGAISGQRPVITKAKISIAIFLFSEFMHIVVIFSLVR